MKSISIVYSPCKFGIVTLSLKEKLRILVVDDTATSRGLITNALQQMGIKNYNAATDGAEAMGVLENTTYHLVSSDYNMPNMDGLELLKSMRQNPKSQRTGFIMITGTKDPGVISQGQQFGMNNYIEKPITLNGLKACIEAVTGPID